MRWSTADLAFHNGWAKVGDWQVKNNVTHTNEDHIKRLSFRMGVRIETFRIMYIKWGKQKTLFFFYCCPSCPIARDGPHFWAVIGYSLVGNYNQQFSGVIWDSAREQQCLSATNLLTKSVQCALKAVGYLMKVCTYNYLSLNPRYTVLYKIHDLSELNVGFIAPTIY